jgi:hypothetical protein
VTIEATKQSSDFVQALDCFAEPVIGYRAALSPSAGARSRDPLAPARWLAMTIVAVVKELFKRSRQDRYLFDLRPDFLVDFLFFVVFFGTFLPSALASERPMAIACLRLLTFLPDRPLFKVPALRFFIARPTLADAFFEYFRAMIILPVA